MYNFLPFGLAHLLSGSANIEPLYDVMDLRLNGTSTIREALLFYLQMVGIIY